MSTAQHIAWRGVDPDRVDTAVVVFDADSLWARGSSVCRDFALDYVLETGAAWVTRRLRVRVAGDDWWRTLDLRRAADGDWSVQTAGDGAPHLPPAGLSDSALLRGALDCDLALCPLTNTPPILRHGLLGAARAGQRVVAELRMAWVAVPDLGVHVSPQRYAAQGPGPADGAAVEFVSEDFRAVLQIDRHGLVEHYPGLAHRLHA
jgi:uncharacterized protein